MSNDDKPDSSESGNKNTNPRALSTPTLVLIAVFVINIMLMILFGPDELPEYRHRAFAMVCALLAGLMTWFLVGDLTLDSTTKKSALGKVSIKATGGIGVFILVLLWWSSPIAPTNERQGIEIKQVKPDYDGYKAEWVARKYNIPVATAKKYLVLLRDNYVRVEELNDALREKSEEYKRLKIELGALQTNNVDVKRLIMLANEALDKAQDSDAKKYLKQAIAIDVAAANKSADKAESLKRSAAATEIVLANIYWDRYEFKEAAEGYKRAIALAKEAKALIKVAGYQMNLAMINLEQSDSNGSIELLMSSLAICQKNDCGTKMTVEIYHYIGKIWQAKQEPMKAITNFKKALAFEDYENSGHSSIIADIWRDLGRTYFYLGKKDLALKYIQKSIDAHLEKDEQHPHLPGLWTAKANVLESMNKHDEAIKLYEKAHRVELKLVSGKSPHAATIHLKLGEAWLDKGDIAKAFIQYQEAYDICVKIFGLKHIRVAEILVAMGKAWDEDKKYLKAIKKYQAALIMYRDIFKQENLLVADIEALIAYDYMQLNEYDKAIVAYQSSLKVFLQLAKTNQADSQSVLALWVNLGDAEAARKNFAEVIVWHSKAIAEYEKSLPKDDFTLAELNLSLGIARVARKQYPAAIKNLQKALRGYKIKFNNEHKDVAHILDALGLALSANGQREKAVSILQQSLLMRRKLLGNDHPSTIATQKNLKLIEASL